MINEAAVIGLPDPKWGEAEEIKNYCILDELPKTHVGKVDKNELKRIGIGKISAM